MTKAIRLNRVERATVQSLVLDFDLSGHDELQDGLLQKLAAVRLDAWQGTVRLNESETVFLDYLLEHPKPSTYDQATINGISARLS